MIDMIDWEFVERAAPVIFAGSGYSSREPMLETEITSRIQDSISVAIKMSKAIARLKEREMEEYTGLKSPEGRI